MALFTPEDSIDAWMQDMDHPVEQGEAQHKPVQSGQGGKREGDTLVIGSEGKNWIRRISYFCGVTSP
jgi:hypothetical protein